MSSPVDKFFATTDSAALFPEYISRAVRTGLESADVLSEIIAAKTVIDGLDYRPITSVLTDDDKALKETAEGTAIPETSVKTQENLVKLKKRGRMLCASYEAIRFQKLDLFTVTLKQIGAYISRALFKDAVAFYRSATETRTLRPPSRFQLRASSHIPTSFRSGTALTRMSSTPL